MQLVIDIHEKDYQSILNNGQVPYGVVYAIMNGTPLPKGHGDLVDRIEVIKSLFDYHEGKKTIGQCVEDVQTIIEADGGGESEE